MHNKQHEQIALSRRTFLAGTAAAGILGTNLTSLAGESKKETPKPPVVLFTKHLGWTDYDELADRMADLGYDGADLTVRGGGHVEPERVEEDLPKAVEAIREVGLDVMMISTPISDPDHPHTKPILKTASALGIPIYRIGSWRYEKDRGILEQLNEYKPKMRDLAAMNKHYNLRAAYHNHSGPRYIGGAIWDYFEIVRDIDPEWIGSNFDIGHAVAEGGCGAWETGFHVIASRIKSSAIKDVVWKKDPERGWRREYPPVGQGMVDWHHALGLYKEIDFTGPLSMHFEYHVHAESEKEEREKLVAAIRRDLKVFRGYLEDVGLA